MLRTSVYRVPTDRPESDGTFSWDATTLVVVEATSGGVTGLGWTYAPAAVGALVAELLEPALEGVEPLDVPAAWAAMVAAVRNAGPWGLAMYAVAAVDIALWDLKARTLDTALVRLLGRRRETVEVYGSGGFCSYTDDELRDQLGGWAQQGLTRVKMKVGRGDDLRRVAVARAAIGPGVELMVDANGAYDTAQAIRLGHAFASHDVRWFEEPVSSDDRAGLRSVRERMPPGVAVAAGEYATDVYGFRALLDAGAVDVLQADVTRCGGITGFLRADALATAYGVPLSAHCAPALAIHPMAAADRGLHIEWFHDHVRIESLLFDGAPQPVDGALRPDPDRPGHGLEFKRADAERFAV
jgi:L-alanine-DL-glutamate epimerase-like enolase superfamily enzyme